MIEENNLEIQQSEVESLQCIYDEQQFKLIIDSRHLQQDGVDTTFQFEIYLPACTDNDDDKEVIRDNLLSSDNDIVSIKYHLKQMPLKVMVTLTRGYPTKCCPLISIRSSISNNGVDDAETCCPFEPNSSIQQQINQGVIHKDLVQIFQFKKMIYERECQELEQMVKDHCNLMLSDEQPMIFSVISLLQEHLMEQVVDDKELDDLLSEHRRGKFAQLNNNVNHISNDGEDGVVESYSGSRIMKLDSHGNAIVISSTADCKDCDTKTDDANSVDSPVGPGELETTSFSGLYKYTFKGFNSLSSSSSSVTQMTYVPYLIFDKFIPRVITKEQKLQRILHYTEISPDSRIPIVYGGLIPRNNQLTHDLLAINSEGKATRIRSTGRIPISRIFGSFTSVSFTDGGEGFVLVGGITPEGEILNDIYLVVLQGPSSYIHDHMIPQIEAKWYYLNHLPQKLCGHTACYAPPASKYYSFERILLFGGYDGEKYSNILYEVLLSHSICIVESCGPQPLGRAGHSMSGLIDNCIFVCGGHNETGILNDMCMFDMKTLVWTSIITTGPAPHLTHCSDQYLMSHSGDILTLHGGYDGKAWKNVLYEYNISEKQWRICCSSSTKDVSSEEKGLAFTSCDIIKQNIAVIGGTSQWNKRDFDYRDYMAVVRQLFDPSSIACRQDFNRMRLFEYNATHDLEEVKDRLTVKQSNAYQQWFRSQNEEDCDVVLKFLDIQDDQIEDENLKGHDMDARILADCDGFKYLYCHKLILSQNALLSRLIQKAEQKQLRKNSDNNDSPLQMNHGKRVVVKMYEQKGLETFGLRPFFKICHFLYTGGIVMDKFMKDRANVHQLYKLAKFLRINLLIQILQDNVAMNTLTNENLFSNMMRLSLTILEPQRMTLEEYHSQIMREMDMEEVPFDIGNEIDTLELDQDFEEEQAVISEDGQTNQRTDGIVKLIARAAYSEHDDSDSYLCINTHKGVLIHRCQYFKNLLLSSFVESARNEIVIHQVNIEGMRWLCRYLYSGLIPSIDPSLVIEVYLATHQFCLEELHPWLRLMIRKFMDVGIACAICDISETLNDNHMRKFCIHYVAKHLDEILANSESQTSFSSLSLSARTEVVALHRKLQRKTR